MITAKYRRHLPQLEATRLLTDGGIETTLIFHDGLDLPLFAAFTLLEPDEGRRALRRYFERYASVARDQGTGFILDGATWRASRDWGDRLGCSAERPAEANDGAVAMLFELRDAFDASESFVISGNIGPRGDGYLMDQAMTADEVEDYHAAQVATVDAAGVDMISANTMTQAGEVAGIARACAKRSVPLALSFMVETDGRLPSGRSLGGAIREVNAGPPGEPSYLHDQLNARGATVSGVLAFFG